MKVVLRRTAQACAAATVLAGIGLVSVTLALPANAAPPPPATPAEIELTANSDLSITLEWPATAGATSYRIYRGTAAGGEGTTPIATTADTEYRDSGLSSTPIYFYQITAVNAGGESPRTEEDASKTPPPLSTGGDVAGTVTGTSTVYYAKDARLAGFDWFQRLTGWFPSVLGSSGASSPGGRVVDMAYAQAGTMTFNNVVVASAGLYTLDWRYAFQSGLFPGVNNRRMGLKVNGTVITSSESFPLTGSFETYQHSALQVRLNAGVNSVQQFAVSDHGLSRVDELTVTPAAASSPSAPTNLVVTASNASAVLRWTASSAGSPTSYSVYRGTISDGESVTAVGTTAGDSTTFTDTGLRNGSTYYYFVIANNAVGGSPTTNEATVIPAAGTSTAPATPTGLAAIAGDTSVRLTWAATVGATSYSVYRGTTAGGEAATAIGTSASNGFTDTGLTNNTTYFYKITATNPVGTSAKSAEVSAAPVAGGTAPAVPFGVVVTPKPGQILLQWGSQLAATSYRVYRGTTRGGEGATPLATVTAPTYGDNAVVSGHTYYYQFTALTGTAESARTVEFTVTAA